MLGVPLELRGREISYLNSLVSYEHRLLVLHELVWLKYLGSRIEYGPMSDYLNSLKEIKASSRLYNMTFSPAISR
jgi:hypothetical protein